MRNTRLAALASVAALAMTSEACAAGFYLQEQGVRGTGRAYSGEVADQGVESLWWNPAAIARADRELYVGANGVFVSGQVTDRGSSVNYPLAASAPIGGEPRAYNPILPGFLPNFAISIPLADRLVLGVSTAAPFNLTTQYDTRAWTRYDALTSNLRTLDLQTTLALKLNDWLDLGAAGDLEHTQARLSNAVPNFFPGSTDAVQSLKGDGYNAGWTVGAQGHFDRLTLGASYRSSMNHTLGGNAAFSGLLPPFPTALNGEQAGKASFKTPWIATFGGRFALTPKLTLDGQVQRLGWSQFQAINVSTGLGPETFAQNYHDTTSGAVGLDYEVDPMLTLRAGAQYDPTPTPNVGRTARVPDGDRWLFSVGATASPTPRLKLDAAFLYIDFKDSTIDHTQPFFAGTLAASASHLLGTVQGSGYVLSLGMRSKF